MTSETIEERIRARAYTLWEVSGGSHGNHEQHWHQAAFELAAAGVPAAKSKAKIAKADAKPAKTAKKKAA